MTSPKTGRLPHSRNEVRAQRRDGFPPLVISLSLSNDVGIVRELNAGTIRRAQHDDADLPISQRKLALDSGSVGVAGITQNARSVGTGRSAVVDQSGQRATSSSPSRSPPRRP